MTHPTGEAIAAALRTGAAAITYTYEDELQEVLAGILTVKWHTEREVRLSDGRSRIDILVAASPSAVPHWCIFCQTRLTGEGDGGGMFDRENSSYCRVAEDRFHMCHCSDCHCGGECDDHHKPQIGIEVKIDGSLANVIRQLDRYAACPELDELILVTTRAKHHHIPRTIGARRIPLHLVTLIENGL